MQSEYKNMLPSMMSMARQLVITLALFSLCYLAVGYYFYRQITLHQEIRFYTTQEARLFSETAIHAKRLTEVMQTADPIANGLAYAEFANALDEVEQIHKTRDKIYNGIGRFSSRPGVIDAISRHNTHFSNFIAGMRTLLENGGKDNKLSSHSASEILLDLEALTDASQEAEQYAIITMLQFNLVMFAGAIAILVWFWFARVRPASRSSVRMAQQAQEMEARLRAEEERARAMLQFSSDAVIAFDERGILESFNLSAENVFGYQEEEVLGRPVKMLMSDSSEFARHRHISNFRPRDLANLANGVMTQGKRKNGEIFTARLIVNEIWSKGRRSFVASIHDMTEEIAARNLLQESLERFDLCVRGSDSAIWDLDICTGAMFTAPRLMQLLGYDEQQAPVNVPSLLQLVHPDDQEIVRRQNKNNAIPGGDGFESRFRMRARNGDYLWFQNKSAYRRNAEGTVVRIAGSLTEITARVNAEEELRRHHAHLVKMVDAQTRHIKKSEARLATAISGISEGLCLVDANKLIVLVNRHMVNLYPEVAEILNPGVALDDVFLELLEKNRQNAPRVKFITEHFNALRSDSPSQELLQPDGGWMRITRAKTQDGGEIILHTDITHYKQQETRLQAQAHELEHALSMEKEVNNLHKQFVTMASHEFRTPLAIIDGSAQIMAREAEKLSPDRIAQRAEKIRSAVSRMTKLIESTLTVARLDAGKIEIEPHECDLRALIKDVCERQQEISPNHQLSLDVAELPDRIIADSKAIDQVLTNLFSNAVKYSPGNPAIRIRGWRAGPNVLVSVRDYGLGIAEEDAPKIFSRYFRAQNSTGIVGTGIGLNLVKELVTLHGGAVHMESKAGLGSTFTIRLPVQGPQKQQFMAASA